jgi:hypothetical protein
MEHIVYVHDLFRVSLAPVMNKQAAGKWVMNPLGHEYPLDDEIEGCAGC